MTDWGYAQVADDPDDASDGVVLEEGPVHSQVECGRYASQRTPVFLPSETSLFTPRSGHKGQKEANKKPALDIKPFTQLGAVSLNCRFSQLFAVVAALAISFILLTLHRDPWKSQFRESPVFQQKNAKSMARKLLFDCNQVEEGVEYWTRASLYQIYPVHNARQCKQKCEIDLKCGAWTWGLARGVVGLSDMCFIRSLGQSEKPQMRQDDQLASGIVCGKSGESHRDLPVTMVEDGEAGGQGVVARVGNSLVSRAPCGKILDGVDLWTNSPLYRISPVMSSSECRDMCQADVSCKVWSWGKPGGGSAMDATCLLKDLKEGDDVGKHTNSVMRAGFACKGTQSSFASGRTSELDGEAEVPDQYLCGLAEDNVEFASAKSLAQLHQVLDADLCRRYCEGNMACSSWSWLRPPPPKSSRSQLLTGLFDREVGTCRLLPTIQPGKIQKVGSVSGIVCHGHAKPHMSTVPIEITESPLTHVADWVSAASDAFVERLGKTHAGDAENSTRTHNKTTKIGNRFTVQPLARPSNASSSDRGREVGGEDGGNSSDFDLQLQNIAIRTNSSHRHRHGRGQLPQGSREHPHQKKEDHQSVRHHKGHRHDSDEESESNKHPRHTRDENKTHAGAHDARHRKSADQEADDGHGKRDLDSSHGESDDTGSIEAAPLCDIFEYDTDFMTTGDLEHLESTFSAKGCRAHCTSDLRCGAFSWGQQRNAPGLTDVCFLKLNPDGYQPERETKTGVISGFPCRGAAGEPTTPLPTTTFPDKFQDGSMLCLMVMQPRGYESGLVKMQYRNGLSIFACDEYAIYSSQFIPVAKGLTTRKIDSDLHCPYGGEFRTALNTGIFFALWDKVREEGRFLMHSWIVKVDPDCVFMPDRLRLVLEDHPVSNSKGLYLNNCGRGLHGPIEVLSRQAAEVWFDGRGSCNDHFTKLCGGDCLWGEDMFIDQCLNRVLHVPRKNEFRLLMEDHCDPPKGWRSCQDDSIVAFHPFKSVDSYRACMVGVNDAVDFA